MHFGLEKNATSPSSQLPTKEMIVEQQLIVVTAAFSQSKPCELNNLWAGLKRMACCVLREVDSPVLPPVLGCRAGVDLVACCVLLERDSPATYGAKARRAGVDVTACCIQLVVDSPTSTAEPDSVTRKFQKSLPGLSN